MHEFPPESKLGFFVGLPLSNVTLQPFTIDFWFEGNVLMSVEHVLEHIDGAGTKQEIDIQAGYGAISLHKLIGRKVTSFRRQPLCLSLKFEDDQVLNVFSDLSAYEAGNIHHQGRIFIF